MQKTGILEFRLKQIFKSNLPLGGLPILVLGDFKQLPPVVGYLHQTVQTLILL